MTGHKSPLFAVTMGEPSGIGGELVLRTWMRHASEQTKPAFFVLDAPEHLHNLAVDFGFDIPIQVIDSPQDAHQARGLPVMPVDLPEIAQPGTPNINNTSAVIESIQQAVDYALTGQVSGIVTNPIHKASLYAGGFCYDGHTEFLGALCRHHPANQDKPGKQPVMMLASSLIDPPLRVVPVTVHRSLKQAIADLRTESIIDTACIVVESLRNDFGITNPRLAVAALNPHAGEEGKMGDEEERILQPAIDYLRQKNVTITPALSADSLFHSARRKTYDAVLCMYHDQALIPLKTLDFRGGVNITLGLPIIRTSPDHGPALDIAGRGQADPESFIAALMMAHKLALHREKIQ